MLDFHLYLLFFLHQFGKFCQSRFISRIKMLETDLKNGKIMFFVNKNHRSERNFCHLRLCSVPILDQERKMTHFRVWVPYRELSKLSSSFLGMRWITDFKTKSGGWGQKFTHRNLWKNLIFGRDWDLKSLRLFYDPNSRRSHLDPRSGHWGASLNLLPTALYRTSHFVQKWSRVNDDNFDNYLCPNMNAPTTPVKSILLSGVMLLKNNTCCFCCWKLLVL